MYNNASVTRDLRIPLADTPLGSARELQALFGNVQADILGGELRMKLASQTMAVFEVR